MKQGAMSPGTGKGFYGWIALTGVSLTVFVVVGTFVNSYGVFLPVICAEFGWSRAVVSTGLFLGSLCFGLPSPLWGVLVAKFGPRAVLLLGNILLALGLGSMSLIQEGWHGYIFYSLAGLGGGLGGMIAGSTVINNWFIRKRALAMGILTASGGVGGFVFPPLATVLISSVGWRMSWLVLAGITIVVAALMGTIILVRNKPEDMGQVPDGISAEPFEGVLAKEHLSGTGERQARWPIRQVLRVPTTWLIAAFTMAYGFVIGTMVTHQVAYLRDLGFSPMTGATTLSLVSGMAIIGSLGFGTLALRFNIRYLASASFGIQLIALGILLTTKDIALIYIYAALLGIANGALLTAMPTFVGTYYERARYSQILGMIIPFQIVSHAAAAIIAGAIYDATGTYTLAFVLLAAISLVGLICVFTARQPKFPQPNG